MQIDIDDNALADTLRYRVQVQKSLPQEDVRVTVEVTALASTRDQDLQALEARIREALNAFIPADWSFSQIRRSGDAVGYERVTLKAAARVPNAENRALTERARRASREGLTLGEPQLDYGLPAERVSEVLETLRVEALRQVTRQIRDIDAATGRAWRIGEVSFGVGPRFDPRRTSKGAYRDDLVAQRLEYGEDGEIAGSERVVLFADVILRAKG